MLFKVGDLAKFANNTYGLGCDSVWFSKTIDTEHEDSITNKVKIPTSRIYGNLVEVVSRDYLVYGGYDAGSYVYLISENCYKYVNFERRLEPIKP